MSSNPYAPLRIEPHPSRRLRRLVAAAALSASLAPWFTPLPWYACAAFSALCLVGWRVSWRRRAELAGPPLALLWDRDGNWFWVQESAWRRVELLGDSYLSPGLVVLVFRQSRWRRRHVVLFRDSLDTVTFRRLKVRLKIEGLGTRDKGLNHGHGAGDLSRSG